MNYPELSSPPTLPVLSAMCLFHKQHVHVFISPFVLLQTFCGWWPDCAEPCGELRAPWDPADAARHHHHAPLCRVWRPAGLADPAQEPVAAQPVGGEIV